MNFDIIRLEINENADDAHFVWSSNPWFKRGGNHTNGLNAGVFAFENDNGRLTTWLSFRVVLNTIFKRNSKINKKNRKK